MLPKWFQSIGSLGEELGKVLAEISKESKWYGDVPWTGSNVGWAVQLRRPMQRSNFPGKGDQ